MKTVFKSGVALLAAVALVGFVQDGVKLKRAPKVGDTIKYTLSSSIEMQGQSGEVKGTIVEKVVEVKESGDYSVDQVTQGVQVSFNGQDIPVGDLPAVTFRFSPLGEVLDATSASAQGNPFRSANLSLIKFADQAVKVGDKWTHEVKSNPTAGVVALKADYEVVASEPVNGTNTLKIKTVVVETEGSQPARSDGHVWVDPATGIMVKGEWKWTNFPSPMGGAFDATTTMVREG